MNNILEHIDISQLDLNSDDDTETQVSESDDDDDDDDDEGSDESETEEEYMQRIANRTHDNISAITQLLLSPEETADMVAKLRNYLYIDSTDLLENGAYLRWIPLRNTNDIKLHGGGIFCNLKYYTTEEGEEKCLCTCKNRVGFFKFHFNEALVFQKINDAYQQLFDLLEISQV